MGLCPYRTTIPFQQKTKELNLKSRTKIRANPKSTLRMPVQTTVVPMKLQASRTTPFRQVWMGRQTTRLRFMNADNGISRSLIQKEEREKLLSTCITDYRFTAVKTFCDEILLPKQFN